MKKIDFGYQYAKCTYFEDSIDSDQLISKSFVTAYDLICGAV